MLDHRQCFTVFHTDTTWEVKLRLFMPFLGAFADCKIGFIMSVGLSVRLHGKTRIPLNGYTWKFTFENLSKIYRKNRFSKI